MARKKNDRRTRERKAFATQGTLERALVHALATFSLLFVVTLARADETSGNASDGASDSATPAATDPAAEPAAGTSEPAAEATSAAAEAEPCFAFPGKFSGSVEAVSDYVFRGVSQTEEGAAIQGELDWKHESGIYLGLWGSNVKFPESDAYLEADVYGGYEAEIDELSVKLGALFYWYPKDESALDYWEFPVELGYALDPLSFTLLASYSPDYFGYAGDAVYASIGAEYALPLGDEAPVEIAIDGSVGYTRAERAVISDRDYVDWTAGATISATGNWSGLGLGLHYTDTDVHRDDSNARFVGSVSYEF